VNKPFLLLAVFALVSGALARTDGAAHALQEEVTLRGVRAHLAALQRIADEHGGDRAAGSPGYAASVDYVRGKLEAAGFEVTLQPFEFTATVTLAEEARVLPDGPGLEPVVMQGSPSTSAEGVTAEVVGLPADADGAGCQESDFSPDAEGKVALIARGVCTFAVKSQNAAQAGAVAALIYNEMDGPLAGSLGDAQGTVPTAGLTRAAGEALLEMEGPVRVFVDLRVQQETQETVNVLAESRAGGSDVVMAGAHLDSVPEGPGINDNGSGVGVVLEIALQLAEDFGVNEADGELQHTLRFAFWGAEELGLLGSAHYVANLTPEERSRILAYLNFDMVASPNAVRFVYGDEALTALFEDHFAARGLPVSAEDLGGGSDHAPFSEVGVPVAGLFTGASGEKTAAEARTYGGRAGAPYDRCYQQACDTLQTTANTLAQRSLDEMADAAADVLMRLALGGEASLQ